MAFKSFSVALPDKNISFKKGPNDTKYVYLATRHYRNKYGTPVHDEISIGRLNNEDTNTMFPNNNYFKHFPWPKEAIEEILPSKIKMVGLAAFLYHIAERIGLKGCLKKVFPSHYKDILQSAFYILSRGGVMMYMDDFYSKHENVFSSNISHKELGNLYENLSKERVWEFFKNWKDKTTKPNECVAYDVTSISTEAKNITFAGYGYNRDGEDMPQINVGTIYSQDSQLPICYELYHGSIGDKSHFNYMVQITEELSLNVVLYVMDRGFITKENLENIQDLGIKYLFGPPSSQQIYKNFLLDQADNIKNPSNYIMNLTTYGAKGEVLVENNNYYAFAYYNSGKANQDEITLYEKIKRRGQELEYLKGKKHRKVQDAFYDIEMQQGIIISYSENQIKIQEKLKLSGMFCLLSNVENLTAEDALTHYRRRNGIEKLYDGMKNSLELSRLRTHSDTSTEGKFFLGFIAQILWADITRTLSSQSTKIVPTVKAALNEMEKIQKVSYSVGDQLLCPLTKKQKDILKAFEIQPDEFTNWMINKQSSL